MIVKLNVLASALGQLNSMILDVDRKNKINIILNVHDDTIDICYGNGTKSFVRTIPIEQIEESDLRGKLIFDFDKLKGIVDSCIPVGKIRTDIIEFISDAPGSFKIRAEKKLNVLVRNPETGEKTESEKVASIVEQRIGYMDEAEAEGKIKIAYLMRERYELLKHYPADYINEHYGDMPLESGNRPMTDDEWDENKDTWDRKELCDLLYKLSTEKSKMMYVSKRSRVGFVQNTSYTVSIPINHDEVMKHVLVLNTQVAKMVADVLYKNNCDKIYIHMIDQHKVAFINEDNTCSVMVTNQAIEKVHLSNFQTITAKKYDSIQFNINRDVLMSCVKGAQAVIPKNQEKIDLKIEKYTRDSDVKAEDGQESEQPAYYRLVITISNPGSSSENRYEIEPEYTVANTDNAEISLAVFLKVIADAINRVKEDYITFDIDISEASTKHIRISGINTEKMAELKKEAMEETGEWTDADRVNNRVKYLTTSTFFAA